MLNSNEGGISPFAVESAVCLGAHIIWMHPIFQHMTSNLGATTHESQLLTPDKVYDLDVELLPACIVVPKGYRIGLSVQGNDYVYPGGGAQGS